MCNSPHSHTHTLDPIAIGNRDHFDHTAHQYDAIPQAIERSERCGVALRAAYPFDKETTTVMDYACGTGLTSKQLAPCAQSVLGVDISQGMIDQFNQRFVKDGFPTDKFLAVRADLKGEDGELDNTRFDVIVCTSAYHHFSSIGDVTRMLAFFLKPGGCLMVIDAMSQEKELFPLNEAFTAIGNAIGHLIPHKKGFVAEKMREVFEGAGLKDFSYGGVPPPNGGDDQELFLAKGFKV